MSSLEWLSLIAAGVFVLVMYTWFVIDAAATLALKRITAELETVDDDVVDELDRMWRGTHDE